MEKKYKSIWISTGKKILVKQKNKVVQKTIYSKLNKSGIVMLRICKKNKNGKNIYVKFTEYIKKGGTESTCSLFENKFKCKRDDLTSKLFGEEKLELQYFGLSEDDIKKAKLISYNMDPNKVDCIKNRKRPESLTDQKAQSYGFDDIDDLHFILCCIHIYNIYLQKSNNNITIKSYLEKYTNLTNMYLQKKIEIPEEFNLLEFLFTNIDTRFLLINNWKDRFNFDAL